MSRRFRATTYPALELSASQLKARDEVASALARGEYQLVDVACPACGASERAVFARRDMYGLPMCVGVCRGCGLTYTSPRMSAAALEAFYDGPYRRLDRPDAADEAAFFALEREKGERIAAFLRANGADVPDGRPVVEIGCGAGGVLTTFAAAGRPVIGVDFGSAYVAYGRSQGLDLHVGGLPEALERMEQGVVAPALVIYEQVLEHVPDPLEELRLLAAALPDDALVYVGVPGLRNIEAHYDADILRYLQIPHLAHFELRTLARVAALAGFDVVAGDETVRAVLRPRPGIAVPPPVAVDEVLARLRSLERRHRVRSLRSRALRAGRRLRHAVRDRRDRT